MTTQPTQETRLTQQDVESVIVTEVYFTGEQAARATYEVLPDHAAMPLHLLTFCVLVLRNGFTVTGEAHAVSPAHYSFEKGKAAARARAIGKLWELEAYVLKQDRFNLGFTL